MSVVNSEIRLAPSCETCGLATVKIGKLPQMGLRPLIHVYECKPCKRILSSPG
jgi:hypothetical protein